MAHPLHNKVQSSLDSIRPFLIADGGDIEIVEITEDNILKVSLLGNCENCRMSFSTMKAGVEASVIREVPEIKEIVVINRIV